MKQLSINVLRFFILEERYLGYNSSLGLFSLREVFLGTISRSNYVGGKSSERQFSSGAISRVILSGGNYLWGNFLGAIIIRETIFLGGDYPRGYLTGTNNLQGAITQGAIVWWAIIQFSSGAIVQTPPENIKKPEVLWCFQ